MEMKGYKKKTDKWRNVNSISLKSFQTNSLQILDKGLTLLRAIQTNNCINVGNMLIEDK